MTMEEQAMNCPKCGHPVTFTERDGQWLARCSQRYAKEHRKMLFDGCGMTRELAYAHLLLLIDGFFARREARKARREAIHAAQLAGADHSALNTTKRGPRLAVPKEIETECPACKIKLRSATNVRQGIEWTSVWCANGSQGTCAHRSSPTRAQTLAEAVERWLETPNRRGRPPSGQSKYDREAPKCPRCGLRMFDGDTHECIGGLSEYARTGEDASGNWVTWV